MSEYKIVAFDGNPSPGGAGTRVPILELDDGTFTSRLNRTATPDVDALVRGGYVTRVVPPIPVEHARGTLVYRHRDFDFPSVKLEVPGITWSDLGDVSVVYLDDDEALRLLDRWAALGFFQALASLAVGHSADARLYARRGLGVVPHRRTSQTAARLYGVLLATDLREGNASLTQREIDLMLEPDMAAVAIAAAARWVLPGTGDASRRQGNDVRREDARLEIGTSNSPRQRAA